MVEQATDRDLLAAFVEGGSEGAFESLVGRHVNLVFATALRRTSDHGAAEEITQNVFMALAQKARWLQAETSLAGWLHQTTLLEARQWWRGEVRRRNREATAASLQTTIKTSENRSEDLTGRLDDALVAVQENCRQALLLRFFEGRNHREIGLALGIGEDAARKRVDKGLAQLTELLRKRGLATGSAVAVLESAPQAAPVGLAVAATHAGLSSSASGSMPLLVGWLSKILSPSRAQLAGLCVALLIIPGVWQGARLASARGEQQRMEQMLAELQAQHQQAADDLVQMERRLRQASNTLAQLESRPWLPVAAAGPETAALDPHLFLWNEAVDYVRVPKAVLDWIVFDGNDKRVGVGAFPVDVERTLDRRSGQLAPTLLTALGLSEQEQGAMQEFFQAAFRQYRAFAEDQAKLMPLDEVEVNLLPPSVRTNEYSRIWVIPDVSEAVTEWRQHLEDGLTQLAGEERAQIIWNQARRDQSLSRSFQEFGAEQPAVIVTPLPSGGLNLAQHFYRDGDPRWVGWNISFEAALNPAAGPEDPTTGEIFDNVKRWLGRPIPAGLQEYLQEWRAAHPDVPNEPLKKP